MRTFQWAFSASILLLGLLAISPKPAAANPDWTKKERKACAY